MSVIRNPKSVSVLALSPIIVTIIAILTLTFGGLLIGAVDPYFGFRSHDNGDYNFYDRSVNVRSLNLGADRLSYVDGGGSHGGVNCTFYRGAAKIAGVGEEGNLYLGLVPGIDGNSGRIIAVSDTSRSTGVWTIDTSRVPGEYYSNGVLRQYPPSSALLAGMGVVGAMCRQPESFRDKLIISFAKVLLNDWLYVPFLVFVLAIECLALALFTGIKARRKTFVPTS